MDIRVEQSAESVVLAPAGDVDLSNSKDLQVQLRHALGGKPPRVIVDLAEVPYMDSSGVATLVEAMQIARRQSTELVLCSLQQKVRSVFEIARLDKVFRITEDLQQACTT